MNRENNDSDLSNEVVVISSLCQWFMLYYNVCPVFFIGSIHDAFKSAFNSKLVKEHRPLLIYIHHNNSLSNNRFCSRMFCKKIIIDYLFENYIVWSWDITNESNRNILIKIWEEIFSNRISMNFSINQCPMLIGIMQRSPKENDSVPILPYEFKTLLIRDTLVRTPQQLNLGTLLDQLIIFKEEFDENEQYLSFKFIEKTDLCWDIVPQIAKYLSLNDAITLFSIDVLPLLWKCKMKLPIVNPSEEFMNTIIKKIKQERIIFLRLETDKFQWIMQFRSATLFSNITLLILDNFKHINQINGIRRYFSKLTCLSFRYENEINFHRICKIFNQFPDSVKLFEIHCGLIPCSHRRRRLLYTGVTNFNTTVESLMLHVSHDSMLSTNDCLQDHSKCTLRTLIDFIKIMSNIRYVRVIIDNGNIETLLDVNEWMSLVKMRTQLDKITLKVIRNISHDTQLQQKIQEVENSLHSIRESIQFKVNTT